MNKYERAAQFWAVLAWAAHNRQVLTYSIMEDTTGLPKHTQADTLGVIADYCNSHKLPLLTSIVVGETDGLPKSGITEPKAVSAEHVRVFTFDWLALKNPISATP